MRTLSRVSAVLLLAAAAVSAQTTWTGATSTAWNNVNNWSPAAVPTGATDVIIAAAANQPSTYTANPSCNNLTVNVGATLTLSGGFDLTVNGNLLDSGTLTVTSTTSNITVTGSWTNDGTFTHGSSLVSFNGTNTLGGTSSSTFNNLTIAGTRTVTTSFVTAGTLTISVGATLDTDVSVDCNGAVSVAGASSSWDLGSFAHTVAGSWTSGGGSATGTGTINFDGTGTTSGGSIANVVVSAGTRTAGTFSVPGSLSLTGGTLLIGNDATLSVTGNASLTAGTLSFFSTATGAVDLLDVEGDVTLTATSGTTSLLSRIQCAGNWSSTSAWTPAAGTVAVDGVASTTIGGASPTFSSLTISNGVKSVASTTAVVGNLVVGVGATLNLGGGFNLSVTGTVLVSGTLAFTSSSSTLTHTGSWTNNGTFTHGSGLVVFNGTGTVAGSAATGFNNLTISAGTRTVNTAATVAGNLSISTGATFDTNVAADVNGSVTLGNASSSWDLGTFTHTVAGSWTSGGGSATATGTINFDGTGTTSGGSIANVLVSAGTRTLGTFSVTTNLSLTGGTLLIGDDATITVGGAASLTSGTLSYFPTATGVLDTLTVTGDVTLTATAGTMSAFSRLLCGGNWSSTSAWNPSAGLVNLNGAGTKTIGGASPTFFSLTASAGTKTVTTAASLGGNLVVGTGVTFDTDAVVDVNGSVTLAAAGSSWDTSGLTHTVAGDWTSTGGGATGSGTILFDGTGTTNGGSIANTTVSAGTRTAGTFSVPGSLSLTGGTLLINDDATVSVAGNASLTAGTLSFFATAQGAADVLDVNGDVTLTAAAGTASSLSRLNCAGNWSSSSAWSPAAGTVALDGVAGTTLGGASPTFASLTTSNGTRTVVATTALAGDLTVNGSSVLSLGGGFDLSVAGNLLNSGTLDVTATNSTITVTGNWTNDGTFTHGSSTVLFNGTGTVGGSSTTTFNDVTSSAGIRTLSTATNLAGNLDVGAGATLDTDVALALSGSVSLGAGALLDADAVVDLNGSISLGTGATWDLDSLTHTVAGNWISTGGSATGAGTLDFDGTGNTSGGAIANVLVSAGTRTAGTFSVPGNLSLTGGTLLIDDDATVAVGGNASLTAGTLDFFATAQGAADVLDVDGTVTLTATAGTMTSLSRLRCAGNWSSSSAWTPAAGTVELDGGTTTTVSGASPTFADLAIVSGSKTLSSAVTIAGDLAVNDTATLDTAAALDLDGSVTMGNATAVWNLGSFTHTVAADWTSAGGNATGTGTIDFNGGGSTTGGSIANLLVSAGTRTAGTFSVPGNLSLTGGTLLVDDDATVAVAGNASLTAGTLSFFATAQGADDVLDVAGDVTLTATAGTMSGFSTLACAGDWSSSAAWTPSAGTVELDGATSATVSGASPTFANLSVVSGTKQATSGLAVAADLDIAAGAILDADAVVDVNGSVSLGAGATWDVDALTHTVAGNWTSAGGNATGAGTIAFDGTGSTSGGAIANVLVSAGTRTAGTFSVPGNLSLTGGTLLIDDDATLAVAGNAALTAGTLSFFGTAQGAADLLDVDGAVTLTAAAGTASSLSLLRCAGNWSSSSAWSPSGGSVELDGGTSTTVGGSSPTFANLSIVNGTKTVTSAATVGSGLSVSGGATFDTNAAVDVNGSVSLAATASWGLGSPTHTVAGNWTSAGGSATGAGTIAFDGAGTTSGGSIANVAVSAGTRTAGTFSVPGNLSLGGGTLLIDDNATVAVAGNASLTAGTLSFFATAQGAADVLDVGGDVTLTATSGSMSSSSRLRCAGNWSSSSAWSPATGTVELDGGTIRTVSGAAPTFANLSIVNGTKTVTTAATINTSLDVITGATLDADAALDVNGSVTLGGAGATWDIGSLTHTVAGSWTSAGGSATGAGTIDFNGTGTTSGGAIANVAMSAGTRTAGTFSVPGNLSLTGGVLIIGDDANLAVAGSTSLTGGTLGWFPTAQGGPDVLDCNGSVTLTSAAGTTSAQSVLRCAGNWSSNSSFAPADGAVELDGAGSTLITALAAGFDPTFDTLVLRNGTRHAGNDMTLDAATIVVEAGAAFDLDGFNVTIPGTVVTVDGTLSVDAGGELALGGGVVATISSGGTLSVIGAVGNPAEVVGDAGGGYALTINGTVAARNFVFRDMGPAGIVLGATSSIAAAPNDLRGGTFDFPSSTPNSVLLDIQRPAAATYRYLTFLESNSSGTFNVRRLAGSPITLANYAGAFGGPAFEDDPGGTPGLIAWVASDSTIVSSFTGRNGAEKTTLNWTTTAEVDIDKFVLEVSTNSPSGPFALLAEVSPVGPSTYTFVDDPATANLLHHYRLSERLTHEAVNELATTSATPYSASLPANVVTVGPSGTFADIQSAVNAATMVNSVVMVTPGTYAAFTIPSSVPNGLRVLGDGTGTVTIDTTLQPLTILSLGAAKSVELSDLTVGSPISPNDGVVVQSCAGTVVLDELVVHGGIAKAGIRVAASVRTAIQRTTMDGVPGLRLQNASKAIASRGSLDELELADSSFLRTCQLPAGSTVGPGSTLTQLAGLMPNLIMPEFSVLHTPLTITMQGTPGDLLFLIISTSLSFADAPGNNKLEMVNLATLSGGLIIGFGTLGVGGSVALPTELPPDAVLLGFPIVLQAVTKNTGTGKSRFGNVASVIGMP